MNKPITYTWFEFLAQLTEWLDQNEIEPMFSEAFALYCAGYSAADVGEYIVTKLAEDKDADGELEGQPEVQP